MRADTQGAPRAATTTGEKVAIKLLDTRQDQNAGRATSSEAAIVREVAALRRAGQHPNVCQLLGYYRLGDAGACHAMVMELCRGGELFRLVERYGAMDESKIRPIFNGVLAGVRHLHAQGIAHRDLKLENILLATSEQGEPLKAPQPKIVDLGLAHAHARGADGKGWAPRELTQFCGSRSYCAPEVMARLGYDGYQADVWSLGVCLFGLVSGFFPVDEASSRDWRFERIARLQHAHPLVNSVDDLLLLPAAVPALAEPRRALGRHATGRTRTPPDHRIDRRLPVGQRRERLTAGGGSNGAVEPDAAGDAGGGRHLRFPAADGQRLCGE